LQIYRAAIIPNLNPLFLLNIKTEQPGVFKLFANLLQNAKLTFVEVE
jgi:hypothetical protein